MQRLHTRLDRLLGKEGRACAATFDERHARHHRIARQRIEWEHQGPPYETVNHQAVLVRMDVGGPGVRDHEVQAIGRDRSVEQMVRRARMLGAWLALGIAERARDAFLEPRRHAVSWDEGARHDAPRVVRQRLGGCGFNQRITRNGGRQRGAAAEKGAAVKEPLFRDYSRPFPFSLGSIAWRRFHDRPPRVTADQENWTPY